MKNRKYFEIIGLLSVIGSLVFVGLEINQNTAAVRGATQQDISYQISEMYKIGVENDKIASIMSRSYQGLKKSELTDTEFLQFWLFSMLGYRRVENIYLQYKNGFLTEEAFDRIGMSFYRTPTTVDKYVLDILNVMSTRFMSPHSATMYPFLMIKPVISPRGFVGPMISPWGSLVKVALIYSLSSRDPALSLLIANCIARLSFDSLIPTSAACFLSQSP